MPERPRSHQLESESKRRFACLIPRSWVFREANPDYGIDAQIEVFDQSGNATGLMFLVQLKATEEPNLNDALAIQFKIETITYYRKLDLPVLIVLFHRPTGQFFWKWGHEVNTADAERGQEYITVRLSREVMWTQETPSLLEMDLRVFRQLQATNLPLPQTFSVIMADREFHGVPAAIVESALIEAAAALSDLLCLSRKNPAGAHPTIVISNTQIVVSLAGLASITFQTAGYPKELVATKLPHDILTAIALVLDRAGHSDIAAQIACQHLDKSRFLETPEVFFSVLRTIAKGRRLTEGIRLAERLLQPEALQWAQFLLVPALMRGGASLSSSEREYLGHLMKLLIERFEVLGAVAQAATAHYNLANHLRAQRGQHDRAALRHYRLASKCDPVYRQRDYFWREVGGVLFGLGRFGFSSRAYEKAVRLGAAKDCNALRADALMSAGKYSEAQQIWAEYLADDSGADVEWRLKSFVLRGIQKTLGIEAQQRRPLEALRTLTKLSQLGPEEVEVALDKALRLDALCALAWFNFGVKSNLKGMRDDALLAFLIAGLIGRNDTEAWTNGLLLSLQSPEYSSLVAAIALVAYKINGERFLAAVQARAQQQSPEFPVEQFVNTIWQIVSSVERPEEGFELRLLGGDSTYQSTKLGLDLKPKDPKS